MNASTFLAAATFALTMSVGAFFLGAILLAAGARWALPFQRIHGSLAGALPFAALGFVPLYRSLHTRDVIALLVLVGFEEWFRRGSLAANRHARSIASASLPVTALAFALFVADVIAPHGFHSDAFGLYVAIGAFGGALGATALVASILRSRLKVTSAHASGLGRLELVAACLWAYLGFSIFLLIWMANLPREVPFFDSHLRGSWKNVLLTLVFGRFVLPFLLLVPRAPKRHWSFVGTMGAWLVIMQMLECVWLVVPNVSLVPRITDILILAFYASVVALTAMVRFRRHALVPNDKEMDRALAYEPK